MQNDLDAETNQLFLQILDARAKSNDLDSKLTEVEKYRKELRLQKMRTELAMIQNSIGLKEQRLKTVNEDISMIESGKLFVGKCKGVDYVMQLEYGKICI